LRGYADWGSLRVISGARVRPAKHTVGLLQQHKQSIPNVFSRSNLITG
jgi:hypothetical protein